MIIKHNPVDLLLRQITSFYGVEEEEVEEIENVYPKVIEKMTYSFSYVNNKYYHNGSDAVFNPLHVGQWTFFLYMVSRELYLHNPENTDLCDKIYGLLKIISSADLFYAVKMPNIWFFDHPQGSVIGRANYGDFFTFSQGCTVGNNKGVYPTFGEHVSMFSGSKVLGKCKIGHHVIFAANSYIIDRDIPSYSIVFGMSRNVIIKSISQEKFNELTKSKFDGNAIISKRLYE